MAIPTQSEMFFIVLRLFGQGQEWRRKDMKALVASTLCLSEEDRETRTNSGIPVFESRTGWAISNLAAAGFLEKGSAAHSYRITRKGSEALLEDGAEKAISRDVYRAIHSTSKDLESDGLVDNEAPTQPDEPQVKDVSLEDDSESEQISPEEQIDKGAEALHQQLRRDLMDKIMSIEGRDGDTFFEELVTKLLVNMGYGIGRLTPASGDQGIDGIVTADALGFDPVYIQAKRYSKGNSVQAPIVQQFAGALGAVTRGVLITTSTFSKGARRVAESYPHATIRLIDGDELTRLMVEYDLGVATERVVKIKRLDSDFFPES